MEAQRSPWQPLEGTSLAVAVEVLRHGPLSRAALARRLALSQASLTRLTKPLLGSGLLIEQSAVLSPSRAGRRESPLEINDATDDFIGIKLTGEALYAVRTTIRADVVQALTVPLKSREFGAVVDAIVDTVETLFDSAPSANARDAEVLRPSGIGISLGGSAPDGRTVAEAHYLDWKNVPLGDAVEERTGAPTTVENDLVALTELERWFGAGRDYSTFAVLSIGAGTGYGLVSGGELMTTDAAGLGLIGHVIVDSAGGRCPLGHVGCAEAALTTWALQSAVAQHVGEWLSLEDCFRRGSDSSDPVAGALAGPALALGRLLGIAVSFTLAEALVLSGEAAALADVHPECLVEGYLQVRPEPDRVVPRLIRPHDFVEWARGAAVVAIGAFIAA